MRFRFLLVFLGLAAIVAMISGCGSSSTPVSTDTPTLEVRNTATPKPTFTPTVSPTPSATATPSPTPTPIPAAIWVDQALPDDLVLSLVQNNEVRVAGSRDRAEAEVIVTDSVTGLEWVLVPVVPFPTLSDDIAWEAIRSYWAGDTASLAYLGSGDQPPTLYCTEPVLWALRQVLGDPAENVPLQVVEAADIVDAAWEARPASWAIVPFDELDPRWKVLYLDGVNVLERGLNEKDYALRLHLGLSGPRAGEVDNLNWTNRDEGKMTVIVMTGVTALVRCTAARMEQYGVLYPGEQIREVLRAADVTHISNEIPFAESCSVPSCQQESLVFCSAPNYIELLRDVGTDVVELTGNHFQDWGSEATIATVKMYDEEGWPHYGGGVDLEDAQKAVVLTDHGNSLSFMGCNPVGPEYAWADEDYPGAAPCDFDYMHERLSELKDEVDVPIVTWQYWEFYHYPPTPQQQEDFRGMIDAGAKIVSGSQAHHPQAMEFYNGGFIHYGLGNLFFDQMWSLGTRQECVDRHVIYDGRHLSTEILTYMLEDYAQPRPMTIEERNELLSNLFAASGW